MYRIDRSNLERAQNSDEHSSESSPVVPSVLSSSTTIIIHHYDSHPQSQSLAVILQKCMYYRWPDRSDAFLTCVSPHVRPEKRASFVPNAYFRHFHHFSDPFTKHLKDPLTPPLKDRRPVSLRRTPPCCYATSPSNESDLPNARYLPPLLRQNWQCKPD